DSCNWHQWPPPTRQVIARQPLASACFSDTDSAPLALGHDHRVPIEHEFECLLHIPGPGVRGGVEAVLHGHGLRQIDRSGTFHSSSNPRKSIASNKPSSVGAVRASVISASSKRLPADAKD